MTILGLNAGKTADADVKLGFRRGWFRSIRVVLTSAGGAAALLALAELLEKQPKEGFALLLQWGPWPFIALVALAFLGNFMSRVSETIQSTFTSVVESSQQNAQAQGRTADALTRLADQGGRQAEEVKRLAIFAAREFPSIYERFDRQDVVLGAVSVSLKKLVDQGADRDER